MPSRDCPAKGQQGAFKVETLQVTEPLASEQLHRAGKVARTHRATFNLLGRANPREACRRGLRVTRA